MVAQHDRPASLAHFGSLLGDPVRSAILLHLSDGSWRPAGELAKLAGASPQAASAHLSQLLESGLLHVEQQGRHRFFRLASGDAAEIMEQLANWIDEPRRKANLASHLHHARLCYDHLAGAVGVQLFERMSAAGLFAIGPGAINLSARGQAWCRGHGIDPNPPSNSRRPIVRLCLDWTERRHHVGGSFGAALTRWMLEQRHIRPGTEHRPMVVTNEGRAFLKAEFKTTPTGREPIFGP